MSKPTRYLTEEELRQIEVMSGLDMTLDNMAAVLGICPRSLDRRIDDQPEVKDAIIKGKAAASLKVRATAFRMASDGSCPPMTMFWLKTKEGFVEKRPEEVTEHTLPADDQELLAEIPTENLLKLVGNGDPQT